MKYGLEYEFFVAKQLGGIVPAYKYTNNLDGNPIVGEIRTGVHDNIVDAVFELKKLIFIESNKLTKQGVMMANAAAVKVDNNFLLELRKDPTYTSRKELQPLEEKSIYAKGGVGKILPRGVFKASLQVNFSENKTFYFEKYERITVEDKSKIVVSTTEKQYSSVFDYVSVILKLDVAFKQAIARASRVPGVYAIKDGKYGSRIEYRSLPNDIDLNYLIETLNGK